MTIVGKWFGFGREEDYDEGIASYDRGDYPAAVAWFERCMARSGDAATVRLAKHYAAESLARLGRRALGANQPEAAIEHLNRAIVLQPNFPDLHFHLSLAHRAQGDRVREAQALARALEINPSYPLAVLYQGILLYEDGELREGLHAIRRAIALEPAFGGDAWNRAQEAHAAGDVARAVTEFEAMAAQDANDADALSRLGDGFARLGRWPDALREYMRATELAPRYADLRCKLGQALLEMDRLTEAVAELEQAVALNPRYADAQAMLGIARRRLGDEEAAQAAFAAALESDPTHIVAEAEFRKSA